MKLTKATIFQLLITAILAYWMWVEYPTYIVFTMILYIVFNYVLYLIGFFLMGIWETITNFRNHIENDDDYFQ